MEIISNNQKIKQEEQIKENIVKDNQDNQVEFNNAKNNKLFNKKIKVPRINFDKCNENKENKENDININNNVPKCLTYKFNTKNNIHKNKYILPLTKINTIFSEYKKTSSLTWRNNTMSKIEEDKNINNKMKSSSLSFKDLEISNNTTKNERTPNYKNRSIKRKTINRGGEEIKNVQITHIICSSKPKNFHITENISTNNNINNNNISSSPINEGSSDYKGKKRKAGISSYSSSCQSSNKVDKGKNLKGKTTVYQHCRGIGMTNDKRKTINSLFYNSEIKKLEPIKKEKETEKVEYIKNFRSSKIKKSNNNNNKIINNKNIDNDTNNNINKENKNNTNNDIINNNSEKSIQNNKDIFLIILLLIFIIVIAGYFKL